MVDIMDLAIERYKHNRDSLFICDGSEGDGKTTMTIGLAYYLAHKLSKPFTVDNLFFDVEKMMKFASETEEQIIIWDEACTMGMATSWQNRIQQKLIKVLMMTRKKRHFFFFNIPKFRKLNEYIVDRALGLIHVYSPDMIRQGHFVYFKKDEKDTLYEWQKERGKKTYKIGWSLRGSFSHPKNIIDDVEYEKRKDQAILDIFKDDVKKPTKDYSLLWKKHTKAAVEEIKRLTGSPATVICDRIGVNYETYSNIGEIRPQADNLLVSPVT